MYLFNWTLILFHFTYFSIRSFLVAYALIHSFINSNFFPLFSCSHSFKIFLCFNKWFVSVCDEWRAVICALRLHWLWLLTFVIFLNRRHCVRICSFSKVNINLLMTLPRQQQFTCSFCVWNQKKKTYVHIHIHIHTIGFHLHGI